jgi:two-component system sensor histidine kinase KdpD
VASSKVVKLKGATVDEALIDFAKREGVAHVFFGQSARSRWDVLLRGSVINRFLNEARDATAPVAPLEDRHSRPGR